MQSKTKKSMLNIMQYPKNTTVCLLVKLFLCSLEEKKKSLSKSHLDENSLSVVFFVYTCTT